MFPTLANRLPSIERFSQASGHPTHDSQTACDYGSDRSAANGDWRFPLRRLLFVICGVFACCLPLAWVLANLRLSEFQWWTSESGPIELASGWGYLLIGAGLIGAGLIAMSSLRFGSFRTTPQRGFSASAPAVCQGYGVNTLMLGMCLVLLACREFDWHKLWTTEGVMKLSYYFDPSVSITEKLVVIVVMGLIGWLLVATFTRHLGFFLVRLRAGNSVALLVAVGLLLLPISKVLDSSRRIFTSLVADIPRLTQALVVGTEELVELAIPICFLTACLLAFSPLQRIRRLFA